MTAAMVAAHAETNVSSVSLVVNGKHRGRVSEQLAARIRDAVDELGYVVDHSASALARGHGDLVILLAPDLSNPFFAEVIAGVQDTLGDRYQLMLSVTERGEQPCVDSLRRFNGLRPAGVLVDAPDETFAAVPAAEHPVVLFDAPDSAADLNALNYDYAPAIRSLAALLAERGHRTVAYLDGSTRSATFALRRAMLAEAVTSHGLHLLDDDVRADVTVSGASAATRANLARWREGGATAVIAAADTLAYGVLAEAHRAGVRIPEDLAVASFDDLPSSAVTAPALTSIALPGAALGRAAAERLVAMLDERPLPTPTPLETVLVRRASL
ncbi:LacI family DNA-binding transcriptional regulator [Saccharopolyspora cebuensis]|uniref:LacI family DNA-binding transcriptional regulator n=1 Tax=Saccharopolyspora cebuensis TaxID=418759 RepID=A0ABV4CIA2_9PSEU